MFIKDCPFFLLCFFDDLSAIREPCLHDVNARWGPLYPHADTTSIQGLTNGTLDG